ncbi:hypothetical protein M407DRAFT_11307 [Tulasnella calospora MUT 4182]|uniref:Glycosyltransferase family 1 protein n=1 Tax=Tulasnella calospora MUT 4182 TaxID=1051891 RepID=A0A0C3Q7Q3_9AGAM|nr:hypothetical protein M407DRAFT_11307 [Tulasnella calospora MUT 4182]
MISPRLLKVTSVLVFTAALFCLVDFRSSSSSPLVTVSPASTPTNDSPQVKSPQAKPLRRRHVAVATAFGHHAEVYGALAWIIGMIFNSERQFRSNSVRMYAGESEFVSLIKELGLLPHSIMHPAGHEGLIADVRSTSLFPDDPGAMIDLVALGTCEIDLGYLGPDLLRAWDERPVDKKFTLVCGTHNGRDGAWASKNLAEWSKRGALRLLTISDQFLAAGYFKADMKSLGEITIGYSSTWLGCYEVPKEDPRGWGYRWSDSERKYLPDDSAPNPPFVLHLLGYNRGQLDIPQELERVVVKDVDFSMDIVIPGFSTEGLLEAYPHIAGVASIVRSASLSEMEAIGLLRGARINSETPGVNFSEIVSQASGGKEDCVGPSGFCQDVRVMLRHGWKKTRITWLSTSACRLAEDIFPARASHQIVK